MADRTEPGPTTGLAAWWWGTNRAGGTYYSGRVHVVHPDHTGRALCGLPVDDVWELRPPMPEYLCPDCCVLAMAASHPAFATAVPQQTSGAHAADTGWFASLSDPPDRGAVPLTEQTIVMPVISPDDDP